MTTKYPAPPAPFRYIGEFIPPRADGLASPLPHGTVVYLDAKAQRAWHRMPERTKVVVNMRREGSGASFYLRATDLRPGAGEAQ